MKKYFIAGCLLVLIAGVSSVYASEFQFTRNMEYGEKSEDVRHLQEFLNANANTQVAAIGAGSSGNETGYYGDATLAAVVRFQELFKTQILDPIGLTKGTGVVGTLTRTAINSLFGHGVASDSQQASAFYILDKKILPVKGFSGILTKTSADLEWNGTEKGYMQILQKCERECSREYNFQDYRFFVDSVSADNPNKVTFSDPFISSKVSEYRYRIANRKYVNGTAKYSPWSEITLTKGGGTAVQTLPKPTVVLQVNGHDTGVTVYEDSSVVLSWVSTNATECTALNDWEGAKKVSGTERVAPDDDRSIYGIRCVNTSGTADDYVTVKVITATPSPVVTLKPTVTSTPNPTLIPTSTPKPTSVPTPSIILTPTPAQTPKPTFSITEKVGLGGSLERKDGWLGANSIRYFIRPNIGYKFTSLAVDGVVKTDFATKLIQSYGNAFYDFTTTDMRAHTIEVTFEPSSFTVTATVDPKYPGGHIYPEGVVTYPDGGTAYYSIVADPGYEYSTMLVDDYSETNQSRYIGIGFYDYPKKFTVHNHDAQLRSFNRDRRITVRFIKSQATTGN